MSPRFQAIRRPPGASSGTASSTSSGSGATARAVTAGQCPRCRRSAASASARTAAASTVPCEAGGGDDRRQEARLLGDGLEEQGTRGRIGRGQRQARVAAARPEVDEPVGAVLAQDREPGQAVDDVRDGDRSRLADGRQVDRGGPGEEQPGVTVDGGTGRVGSGSARARQAPCRGRRRMRRGGPGCPERASGAARAVGPRHASSGSRAIRPRGATPGVGIGSHRGLGTRSSAVGPVHGRVSPGPSPSALPSRCPSADAGR